MCDLKQGLMITSWYEWMAAEKLNDYNKKRLQNTPKIYHVDKSIKVIDAVFEVYKYIELLRLWWLKIRYYASLIDSFEYTYLQ